jgi:succinate dehydrogenase / fumarate reductase iron-sulfur subunit
MAEQAKVSAETQDTEQIVKTVTFHILRYDPNRDAKPYIQDFQVPVRRGMTVLDGLVYIKENLDGSLAWRSSCRMGVCGSCGMFINSFPRLACQTQILHLESNDIHVKPMPNYDIIKDLVPDVMPMLMKHKSVKPYVIRDDMEELESPTGEYFQSPQELENYIQFSYCIKCGLCLAACPTVATDDEYLGPQALAQVFRYNRDTRDAGNEERYRLIDRSGGPWSCHFAGACSDVCPKGVDPGFAIQLLKRDMLLHKLRLKKRPGPAPVMGPPEKAERRPNIPEPPEPTV